MMKQEKVINLQTARRKTLLSNLIFDVIIYLTLIFVVIVTVYPFWNTLALSFNDGLDSLKGGITFFPRKFIIKNYLNRTPSKKPSL